MSTTQGFGKQEAGKKQFQKEKPEQKTKPEYRSPQLQNVLQLIQNGAKLSDLNPEQLKELEETAGNQTVLELFRNSTGTLPLAKLPGGPAGDTSGLPVNEVEIRWPALFSLTEVKPKETKSKKNAWPAEQIRPMGTYEGGTFLC